MFNKRYITETSEDTRELGKNFAKQLKQSKFIAFYGELGSGKTTFIQGLAQGMGISRRIISPTFIIVRHYLLKKGNFYHIDLYRTNSLDDLSALGLEEIINEKSNIIAVEWAEKLSKNLPKERFDIYCKYLDEGRREITIKSNFYE